MTEDQFRSRFDLRFIIEVNAKNSQGAYLLHERIWFPGIIPESAIGDNASS